MEKEMFSNSGKMKVLFVVEKGNKLVLVLCMHECVQYVVC